MDGKIVAGKAKPRANYQHGRRAGDFIFVSGTSSRRADNSIAGAETTATGVKLDVGVQTAAVLDNIADILKAFGAGLEDVCEMQCFLVDMADYAGFNEAWNRYFGPGTNVPNPPTRTTVAVKQLPHPHLAVEIRATAYKPA
jgi:2-aminomuconate deaminase